MTVTSPQGKSKDVYKQPVTVSAICYVFTVADDTLEAMGSVRSLVA